MSNPLRTCPGLVERNRELIHLCLRNDPMVVGYQFWGARTVDDAYGDPVGSGVGGASPDAMFEVSRGMAFRSPALRASGRGQIIGSIKGQTHVAFALSDYNTPGLVIPPDHQWLFLRTRENRTSMGLLSQPGVPEAMITLTGVLAGDQVEIKGVIFEFAAGANNLVGKAGTLGDPFLVGLGAGDNDAAANLAAALNDNGDVAPVMDLIAPLNTHTFATNPGAPSADVLVQPEDAGATLLLGNVAQFSISTTDQGRMGLDAAALSEGRLVWAANAAVPVLGPIFCIPSSSFFGMKRPSFTLQGTAPSSTACVAGAVPDLSEDLSSAAPRAMHLVFPGWLGELAIRNLSLVPLLVSFGPGHPMQSLSAGQQLSLTSPNTSTKEILLACPVGVAGAAFTLHGAIPLEM